MMRGCDVSALNSQSFSDLGIISFEKVYKLGLIFLNNLNDFLNLFAGTNVSRLISTLKKQKSAITLVPSVHVVTLAQVSKIS